VITLSLPYPPTTNNLYANWAKGRHRTPKYEAWLKEAGWSLAAQHPGCIDGGYHLFITAERPDRRARDIDNLIKPVSDLLKKQGVITDDSQAASVCARWGDEQPAKGAQIRVRVEPLA
jgi:crossover junction endodeoxyribonuclease RusA